MYFGEYLINNKIINEDQLLDALIFQLESLPSFLRILKQERIISSSEIFRLIKLQIENDTDLISVLRTEKKIDNKSIQGIYQKQLQNKKILGSVLVELKIVEQTIIEKMLHQYLRDENKDKERANAGAVTNPKAKIDEIEISEAALESMRELELSDEAFTKKDTAEFEIEISEAALESMREFGLSDEAFTKKSEVIQKPKEEPDQACSNLFVEKYLDVYNEKMNKKLGKLISFINQSAEEETDISNYINSFYRYIYILKVPAQLAGLDYSAKLLDEFAEMIELKLLMNNGQLLQWGVIAIPIIEKSIVHLWEIRVGISHDQNENILKNNQTLSDRHQNILSSLNSLKKA